MNRPVSSFSAANNRWFIATRYQKIAIPVDRPQASFLSLQLFRRKSSQQEMSSSASETSSDTGLAQQKQGSKPTQLKFYNTSLRSAKYVVAPMVDGSELAWRILSRYYGAELCYTPMIHSALFAEARNTKYRQEQFDLESGEEGSHDLDRPLLAQFCANDPETLLAASNAIVCPDGKILLDKVDGFDLNLGCPQGIAKKGKYGAFLMDHLDLIDRIVSHLHQNSSLPVTVKYRCFDSEEETNAYTERLIKAGAQLLTIHGRTRAQKGQFTGLADWRKIRAAVEIGHRHQLAVFGNGNILTSTDALRLMETTGCDGVMTAEGNLYNPAIFGRLNSTFAENYRANLPAKFREALGMVDDSYKDPDGLLGTPESLVDFPNCTKIASQYLAICRTLETRTATSAIKGHLYKIFRPVFDTGRYNDIREILAQISWSTKPSPEVVDLTRSNEPPMSKQQQDKIRYHEVLSRFQAVVDSVGARLESDRVSGILDESMGDGTLERGANESGLDYLSRLRIPYSRCQPYVRPIQVEESPSTVDVTANQSAESSSLPINKSIFKITSGPVNCSNSNGCANSGAVRCKWKLCKTCCAERSSKKTISSVEPELCEVHAARAKIEEEKRAFKAARRRRKMGDLEGMPKLKQAKVQMTDPASPNVICSG